MAHTHEFDCIVCGAHFDSSKDVARHNDEVHMPNATGMERPRTVRADSTEREDRIGIDDRSTLDVDDNLRDRNPGQGFADPRSDSSDRT